MNSMAQNDYHKIAKQIAEDDARQEVLDEDGMNPRAPIEELKESVDMETAEDSADTEGKSLYRQMEKKLAAAGELSGDGEAVTDGDIADVVFEGFNMLKGDRSGIVDALGVYDFGDPEEAQALEAAVMEAKSVEELAIIVDSVLEYASPGVENITEAMQSMGFK